MWASRQSFDAIVAALKVEQAAAESAKGETQKPTLGIMPRKLWLEERFCALGDAIDRRKATGKEIPKEWVEEYSQVGCELTQVITPPRWQWMKPDKLGLWWWGSRDRDANPIKPVHIRWLQYEADIEDKMEGWWSFICDTPPLPLLPKKKVVQTLYLVPAGWAGQGGGKVYFEHWLSPDDTIPPGAKQTTETREVEV